MTKDIPKSINKLTGIVKTKVETNNKDPTIILVPEYLNILKKNILKINDIIVVINKIRKEYKSSIEPTSFSVSFNKKNFKKLFKILFCFKWFLTKDTLNML